MPRYSEYQNTVVIEAAPVFETKLSAYYHKKGLYPEQVQRYREACLQFWS